MQSTEGFIGLCPQCLAESRSPQELLADGGIFFSNEATLGGRLDGRWSPEQPGEARSPRPPHRGGAGDGGNDPSAQNPKSTGLGELPG